MRAVSAMSIAAALLFASPLPGQENQTAQEPTVGTAEPRSRTIVPSHPNMSYGPYRRNVMDVWIAESDSPTPVLVSIHGGGFRGGDKSVPRGLLRECLARGISVAAITYRLTDEVIAPTPFLDAARAVQYIRSRSTEWKLDPSRVAATGSSAGAGISLWLGFHDDLADPTNADPVLRQSSRLSCMAVTEGQSSYDPRFIRKLFPEFEVYKHPALGFLYGVDLNQLDQLQDEKYRLFEEASPLTYLSNDDPPVLLLYRSRMETEISDVRIGIHHPRFGQELKQLMDALDLSCRVETGVPPEGGRSTQLIIEFLEEHLRPQRDEP